MVQLASGQYEVMNDGDVQASSAQEQARLTQKLKIYLEFYDQARLVSDSQSDLTIQRWDGDLLSLLSEIVMSKENRKLFPDPNFDDLSAVDNKINHLNLPLTRKTPSSSLSCVNEGDQSELESQTVYPRIEVRFEGNDDGKEAELQSQYTQEFGMMTFGSSEAHHSEIN